MFTGIIEGKGRIHKIERFAHSLRLSIEAPFSLAKDKLGDSIAIDGCCLTLTRKNGKIFSADISPETLNKTSFADYKKGDEVNLERALRVGDRLGGHWVQGHVDAVGKVKSIKCTQEKEGVYLWMWIQFPKSLKKYFVKKGSVTVSGVSLTINDLKGDAFQLCLIPHTQKLTTLTGKKVGARVNLEADILAKYLVAMQNASPRT